MTHAAASLLLQLVALVRKQLPPSAASLHLLDVNGELGDALAQFRADLALTRASGDVATWSALPQAGFDAIIARNYALNADFLARCLDLLRPGGRLIVVNELSADLRAIGGRLEDAGYVRILVEAETLNGAPVTLIRGERAHQTTDTLARVQVAAAADSDRLSLADFRGRYVHLLVVQTPNLPPWRRDVDVDLRWQALAVGDSDGQQHLLAFSSLPKAVSFLQPAVLSGQMYVVNKVAKWQRDVIADWEMSIWLNPPVEVLNGRKQYLIDVDRTSAEASDE